MTKLLVDGDIFAFRCAAAAELEDEGIAKYYVEKLLDDCLAATGSDSFSIFLSGKENFRYRIYPEYKANRLDTYRPRHLGYLRDHLVGSYSAVVSDGCEADDLLGIAQCESKEETVICSLDKDLLMIPGRHYSWEISGVSKGTRWVKEAKHQTVSEEQGLRHFYYQCLVGDSADNVAGAKGIGPKRAGAILERLMGMGHGGYIDAIRDHYSCDDELNMIADVLWIWREPEGTWSSTVGKGLLESM